MIYRIEKQSLLILAALACWAILDQACHWTLATAFSQEAVATAPTVRQPWTTSRMRGSPELPLPLELEPVFPGLKFIDPMHVRWHAELKRYFVCELSGKIWSFPHDPAVTAADLVVDLKADLKSFDAARFSGLENVYSIVFDPEFAKNRFIYVCLVLKSKSGPPQADGSRISRFQLSDTTPPTIDVASELPIITWLAGGHNGCDLAFDRSGCLLFSTGDAEAPSPPDKLKTGQDISDLLSSILRIDVRGATAAKPYQIPSDNPFISHPKARPEVWAYGFRNPWRIALDPQTGRLWLGDVGWEKWEMIHAVQSGSNAGWSVREGVELLQPGDPIGPTPIQPPRVALSHADAASITGGFVYAGDQLKELRGQYLFGDWITGRIWAVPTDEHSPHHEVASGQLRIIAFAPDRDGEPLVVNHFNGTTLFKLVANRNYQQQLAAMREFPKRLSETGLFADTAAQLPAPGVRPFSISQPQWQDGARADHWLALPDTSTVTVFSEPQPLGSMAMFNSRLHYPAGAVLAKTLSLPQSTGDRSRSPRRIETQILHFDGRLWHGYSYLWNAAQTDAELVVAEGTEIRTSDPSLPRWRVHSRTECFQCHNPWAETTLAFTPEQLDLPAAGDASPWRTLAREGYVVTVDRQRRPVEPAKCVRKPLGGTDDTASRARAYLHVNCAHCHMFGAGAAVDISLKITEEPQAMKCIDVMPLKGSLGLPDARIITAGHADQSVLAYRMASTATGRMPHIGSREVDYAGLSLIAEWINQLETNQSATQTNSLKDWQTGAQQLLAALETARAPADTVDADAHSQRIRLALDTAILLARARHAESLAASQSPSHAALRQYSPQPAILALAQAPDPLISSLFEAHVAPEQRQRRLGTSTNYAEIADVVGNRAAGETLFFDTARWQCSKCHRVGNRGQQLGPDLTEVGRRLSPAQLFESLADPSRVIDPKYQSIILVTHEGKVVTGLLHEETKTQITLINSQGERVAVALEDVESRRLDTKSLMPSGMANDLTAQQAADLLAFLSSLR